LGAGIFTIAGSWQVLRIIRDIRAWMACSAAVRR